MPLILNVLDFFLAGSTARGGCWTLGSGISIYVPTEQTSGSVLSNWRALVAASSSLSYFSGSIFESLIWVSGMVTHMAKKEIRKAWGNARLF
jgi:hypothetical protein